MGMYSSTWKTEAASCPRLSAATASVPPWTFHEPESTKKPDRLASSKVAERSTSRRPPGTLPGCGSRGPPVWSCHSSSFWVMTPTSAYGSPLRSSLTPWFSV